MDSEKGAKATYSSSEVAVFRRLALAAADWFKYPPEAGEGHGEIRKE